MKRKLLVCLLLIVVVSGCASTQRVRPGESNSIIPEETMDNSVKTSNQIVEGNDYIPKHAMMNPESQVSRLHPNEIRKAGVKEFTIVRFKLNFGLLILEDIIGEWPIIAHISKDKEIRGYAYYYALNSSAEFWAEAIFLCKKEELEKAKVFSSNRDGGFFYDLEGKEYICDLEDFDKKPEYRDKFFQDFGSDLSEYVEEIVVDSKRWEEFISLTNQRILESSLFPYTMANGEVRVSLLPEMQFKLASTRSNDWDTAERAFKNGGKIPLTISSFTGFGMPALVAANLIGGALNDCRTGSYARANGPRHQISPTALKLQKMIQEVLEKKERAYLYNN